LNKAPLRQFAASQTIGNKVLGQMGLLAGSQLEAGLIHSWSLDGNSNDLFVTGNGTDTAVTYTTPKLGTACAAFNGSTSKIQTAIDGPLGASPRSISCWFRLTDAGNSVLISYGTSTATNLFQMSVAGASVLRIYTGSADIISVAGLTQNTWYHAVVTYDGTTTKLYLNGAAPVTSTETINTTHTDYLSLGYGPLYGYIAGLIDEVDMWDRALTAGEVSELYNGSTGKYYPF
jgi:hypothetical protein